MAPDPSKVFIIHGRNRRAADEMGTFLRALSLEPIIFDDLRATMGGTPSIPQIVTRGMDEAHVVIALLTGDEYSALRAECRSPNDQGYDLARWQARPNVIFEAGMAFGRDPTRLIMVLLGEVQLFSDLAGIHVLQPANDPRSHRETLRRTLKELQCRVSESSAWMNAGDFEACIHPGDKRCQPFGLALGSRGDLPLLADWEASRTARDILIIGHNLGLVMRQWQFLKRRLLEEGLRLRLLIVDPKGDALIETLSRGVMDGMYTRGDFGPALIAMRDLRLALPESDRERVDLRTLDYVPTLSGQVLDGDARRGTVLVELVPNAMAATSRPHFLLFADNRDHRPWFERFRENFETMFDRGKKWDWSVSPS